MRRQGRRAVYAVFITAAALAAAWSIYGHLCPMPTGPVLPPQPPDKEFSERVIALNNRAVEIQSEDPEGALRLYNEALKADPEYHLGYANKAQLLLQHKRYVEAATCYEKLAELRPRAAEYYVGHAFCLQRQGMQDEARGRLLHALSAYNYRMKKSPFPARFNRAMVLSLLGREAIARKELDDLADQWPEYASMVSALRQAMNKATTGDRWSILGLDE